MNRCTSIFALMLFASGVFAQDSSMKVEENGEVISGNSWLTHTQLGEGIWVINDNQQDNVYLVEGDRLALVIDTGIGFQNLKTYVQSITAKPLVVVNTHGHPDHAGGNHVFDEVHIHKNELDVLGYYTSEPVMKDTYNRFAGTLMPDHLLDKNKNTAALILIDEGFQFDLGNRTLKVIHLPAHSPGSIALYDTKSHHLFTGDAANQHVWLQIKYALSVEDFLISIRKLLGSQEPVNLLLPGHGEPLKPDHLNVLAAGAEKIIAGKCEVTPYDSPLGKEISCHHKDVVIVYKKENIKATSKK
ncbi:MBL fold metallo-hydrolase [Saccharophagus sp. K07]|jgi:hydroxyacylglutathione hydrolase|uniref:MBL fold metallo-hydrolase n=1 Tax=Saccharophagus sp. K07 TaxID=2283636 RepID=UPI001651EC73|nr:MBL fold metallo-hydrolase [Saccharophagus sp. K07]MBC6906718.1 MBL fold metallo-hydrolase [Saccharophagus sp. K07]